MRKAMTHMRSAVILLLTLVFSIAARASVKVEKVEYKGWQNCYRVSNGTVELIVTGDVGPRIIRYAFIGSQNLFKEYPEQLGKSGESTFQFRGGDRVWKAPEDPVASWALDNVAVHVTVTANGVIAQEPVEPATGLQKEIEVRMEPAGTAVTVYHRIANHSLFPLEFAPWSLTQMAPGGFVVSGFPPRGHHPQNLEATNPLVMWAYTNMADPRMKFTRKYLTLRQDPANNTAQKIGMFNRNTWAAYLLNGEAFVKRTTADPSKTYPDFGASFETFTNSEFLEVETLGALSKVQPGGSVELVEHWALFKGIKVSEITDDELDRVVMPLVDSVKAAE